MELAKLEFLEFLEQDEKYRCGIAHLEVMDSIVYVKLNSFEGMDYKPIIKGYEGLIELIDGLECFPYLKFLELKKQRESDKLMMVYIQFKDFSGKEVKQ